MNKLAATAAAVLFAAVLLCSCAEEKLIPPEPTEITVEAAKNSAGKRFDLTLDELSRKMDETVKSLSDSDESPASIGKWEVISKGLVDDNGVNYTSYRNKKQAGTLTAAVEDDSGKLMNVGCGCEKAVAEDKNIRGDFVTLTAVLAEQAGGFTDGDLRFLKKLVTDLLDGEDDRLFYENVLYSRSEYEDTVVIIMTPSAKSYATLKRIRFYGTD